MAFLLRHFDDLALAEYDSLAMPVVLLIVFLTAAVNIWIGLIGVPITMEAALPALASCAEKSAVMLSSSDSVPAVLHPCSSTLALVVNFENLISPISADPFVQPAALKIILVRER